MDDFDELKNKINSGIQYNSKTTKRTRIHKTKKKSEELVN